MNLLNDRLITLEAGTAARESASLPELIARLLVGPEVRGFPLLAASQQGYWWRFLVRCAARALVSAGLDADAATTLQADALAQRLRSALLQHTEVDDWALASSDARAPAFLQSPAPVETPQEGGYRPETCALLTAVIGTREHERKSQAWRRLRAEELIYALVEYQFGVVFGGRGNYESQLMGSRSGAGSGTPFMGVSIGHSFVRTFRHDVETLLAGWDAIAAELRGDVWALWREPWDGVSSLPASRLDPAFIPYARMVRVAPPTDEDAFERVWFKPSRGGRVADHTNGGVLGDPFTPLVVDPKGGHLKVRGALEQGYGYAEVVRLLFPRGEDSAHPSATVSRMLDRRGEEAGDVWVVFEGLAFQQGKTRGFHQRAVRLPSPPPKLTFTQHYRDPVQQAHPVMLEATKRTARVLRAAFALLTRGVPRPSDDDRSRTAHVLTHFDELVDSEYLQYLLRVPLLSGDRTLPYRQWLFATATQVVFPRGVASLPRTSGRQLEHEVRAEAYLRWRLQRELELPAPEAPESVAPRGQKEAA